MTRIVGLVFGILHLFDVYYVLWERDWFFMYYHISIYGRRI